MVTAAHITKAARAVGAGDGFCMPAERIARRFNRAMRFGDFDTERKVAHLIAQSMQESAFWRTTEEFEKDRPYSPFIGRTFIQVTHEANYRRFGRWCKDHGLVDDADVFVRNPVKLAAHRWAALGPVWYFENSVFDGKTLTQLSQTLSVRQVSAAINLGSPFSAFTPNGLAERESAFTAVKSLGNLLPTEIATGEIGPKPPGKLMVVTTAAGLNARTGPGLDHPVKRVWPQGAVLRIVDVKNGWAKGSRGLFVSAEFLAEK